MLLSFPSPSLLFPSFSRMLSTTFFPQIKFSSIHLIEPTIMGSYGHDFGSHLIDGAGNRRDTWKSAKDAYEVLKGRHTW